MKNQTGFIDIDFGAIFMALLFVGGVIGAFCMWLVPIVWGWIKPIIHAITA